MPFHTYTIHEGCEGRTAHSCCWDCECFQLFQYENCFVISVFLRLTSLSLSFSLWSALSDDFLLRFIVLCGVAMFNEGENCALSPSSRVDDLLLSANKKNKYYYDRSYDFIVVVVVVVSIVLSNSLHVLIRQREKRFPSIWLKSEGEFLKKFAISVTLPCCLRMYTNELHEIPY